MIWVAGRIVDEEALYIPVSDRTFEHGLGLFETLRTWAGSPVLLPRHASRMLRSAEALGLSVQPAALPDADAVEGLLRADGVRGDVVLRLTLSGGRPDGGDSKVWMRHAPLPPPSPDRGAVVIPAPWIVAQDDPLARHKTLNYWSKRLAYEVGCATGADEVLFNTADGRIWEGSRMNLFLVREGKLMTPDRNGPILPGVMRGLVLEVAAEIGLATSERDLRSEDLERADEVFLTNSVRGLVPVGRISGWSFSVPGPMTSRLSEAIERRLHTGDLPP